MPVCLCTAACRHPSAGTVDGSSGTVESYDSNGTVPFEWKNNASGTKSYISCSVYEAAGTVDLLFKPMLRLASIKDDEYVILLDLHGEMLDSVEFAKKIDKIFVSGKSTITFVIGGSLGVSEELVRRANFRFKMSDLTFPHQLVRVLLVEQIYRAFTIQKGITYHK